MATELVFRVEHGKHRYGPYRPGAEATAEVSNHASRLCRAHSDEKHPGPYEDRTVRGSVNDVMNGRFGFVTLKAFARWFTQGELDRLRALGYVIRAYKGRVIWEGRSGQCVFHPGKNTRPVTKKFGLFTKKLVAAKKNR